jgi:phospholipase D1/2
LGVSEDAVADPLTDELIEWMNQVAEQNTQIYREIFACYPDDNIKLLSEIEEFKKKQDLSKYEELAPNIQGHLVWYPLEFLANDQLSAPMNTVEYYISDQTFV